MTLCPNPAQSRKFSKRSPVRCGKGRIRLQPKKTTYLVIGTTVFVIAALVFVFWLSSLRSNERPTIVVPDPSYTEPDVHPTLALLNHPDDYLVFDLTPETVGDVLRTLKTPDSYSLTLTSSVLSEGARSDTAISFFHSGGMTRISVQDPLQAAEYLISGDSVFCWPTGETVYQRYALGLLDGHYIAKMPATASLAALDPSRISRADFVLLDDQWTICIEYTTKRGLHERSYVSIDSGLVMKNEAYCQEELILDMYVVSQTFEPLDASLFLLPDGASPQ